MPVNLNGMDPRVLRALQQIQDEARRRGIQTNVISGFRTYQDQVELAANAEADRTGQPLPYPARGHVPMAAAPGTSLHEKGLAFDLQATNPSQQAELWDIGHNVGLQTIGEKDPTHFELASAGGPYRTGYAQIKNASPFLLALQSFESGDWRRPEKGGSNIANVHQGTSSGQAQGYNQITTGTWKEFGGLAFAPTPLEATKEQQDAVAAKIPLKRWDPKTLAYLQQKGFKIDPGKTLGENIALNGGTAPSGAAGGGAAPQNGGDWQALLGAEAPPEFSDLGSTMSDAVVGRSRGAQEEPLTPIEPMPQFDQSYALASAPAEDLGARYQRAKDTRKLTPLGQLFTLPTIGQPAPKVAANPQFGRTG
jgi:hypothetical protein